METLVSKQADRTRNFLHINSKYDPVIVVSQNFSFGSLRPHTQLIIYGTFTNLPK